MIRMLPRAALLAAGWVLCSAGAAASGVAAPAGLPGTAGTASPARTSVQAPQTSGSARWQWPLPGRPTVTRAFQPPATPYGPGHRGVDLAGRPGMPVLAAGAGVVGYAGVLAGRGVVSVLHEGGLRTTYEPVTVSVRAGQRLPRGGVLGALAAGHAGCPVAACLHWGLLRGETYLDPLALLGAGRVRLLPLDGPAAVAPIGGTSTAGRLNPVLLAWPLATARARRQSGDGEQPAEPGSVYADTIHGCDDVLDGVWCATAAPGQASAG